MVWSSGQFIQFNGEWGKLYGALKSRLVNLLMKTKMTSRDFWSQIWNKTSQRDSVLFFNPHPGNNSSACRFAVGIELGFTGLEVLLNEDTTKTKQGAGAEGVRSEIITVMKHRIQAGERRKRYNDIVDNEKVAWPSSWVTELPEYSF